MVPFHFLHPFRRFRQAHPVLWLVYQHLEPSVSPSTLSVNCSLHVGRRGKRHSVRNQNILTLRGSAYWLPISKHAIKSSIPYLISYDLSPKRTYAAKQITAPSGAFTPFF